MRLFIYLTPCIPLSFKGEGDGIFLRGFAPLGLTIYSIIYFTEKGELVV